MSNSTRQKPPKRSAEIGFHRRTASARLSHRLLRPTRVAHGVYFIGGRMSSAARMLPDFLIVGAQRCGTSMMHHALSKHPGVLGPVLEKEVHYFDVAYERGPSWYQAHFPLKAHGWWTERLTGVPPLVFEASPYYMFHPLAAERIARDLPGVKLLALIRDPTERAYSAHAHEVAIGHERLPFEAALELEDNRLEGEVERMMSDPHYDSYSHRHHAYRTRGQYIEQFERLDALFGRDRICVIDSGDFWLNPEQFYDGVLDFLGLPHGGYPSFDVRNERSRAPMPESLRAALDAHFLPFDERLADWLGCDPSWRR